MKKKLFKLDQYSQSQSIMRKKSGAGNHWRNNQESELIKSGTGAAKFKYKKIIVNINFQYMY